MIFYSICGRCRGGRSGDFASGGIGVCIHNGGGVGWGEVSNGGFGLVLDGTDASKTKLENMLFYDVNNGIARRAWARNSGSLEAIEREMKRSPNLTVTMPNLVDEKLLQQIQ